MQRGIEKNDRIRGAKMNRITLECLNNLLQPVNMRCAKYDLSIWVHTPKEDYELYDTEGLKIKAVDLGFEIVEGGE